jgi:endonuclease YncB( thermonuclease family)
MKKIAILFVVLFVLTAIAYYSIFSEKNLTPSTKKTITAVVERVIDGDTIVLENGEKIRLLGINTPEKKTFLSNASFAFTNQIANKTVEIEITEKDKYGRNLGYIFYDGKFFNEEILRNGLAHTFIYTEDEYTKRLREAERQAQEKEIGLWKKSENFGCLVLKEFKHTEDGKRCTNREQIILENFCGPMRIYLKDDATHAEYINLTKGIYSQNFSCVFNDDGDSLYIWDSTGILIFERY